MKALKTKLSLMPIEGIEAGALAFTDGAQKYGRNSFKVMKDAKWTECIDSLLRHANKFNSGETFDSESGCSHLGHIIARASMLEYWRVHGIGTDDRNSLQLKDKKTKVKQRSNSASKTKKPKKGKENVRKNI